MNLSSLPKITQRKAKRVGRGVGSGKGGHTTGRGAKGQKAREKVGLTFEGTKFKKSLIKRLPLLRGKGRLKPNPSKLVVFNLDDFVDWPVKIAVTHESLVKAGWIKTGQRVKILGDGEIKSALTVEVATSGSARKKIEAAGGKIVEHG